jgi:hypothetical protein
MKRKIINVILTLNMSSGVTSKIQSQPPINRITKRADISKMFPYSPKKNMANIIEEYSTLYPATNSASASGKSKGDRLVSAKIDIKNIIANGNKGKMYHTLLLCKSTMSIKFKDPVKIMTGISIIPIEIS